MNYCMEINREMFTTGISATGRCWICHPGFFVCVMLYVKIVMWNNQLKSYVYSLGIYLVLSALSISFIFPFNPWIFWRHEMLFLSLDTYIAAVWNEQSYTRWCGKNQFIFAIRGSEITLKFFTDSDTHKIRLTLG